MKIGLINASSQKDKNIVLEKELTNVLKYTNHKLINFGVFSDELEKYSYIQVALMISLLLSSNSVDFIVTGCSSGNGMMLACNSLPDVFCGYTSNSVEAFLFGRINNGNAISFPLGLNYGWGGELNLRYTLEKLFEGPFGEGYPVEESKRKIHDTNELKQIKRAGQVELIDLLPKLDKKLVSPVIKRSIITNYILENGKNDELKIFLSNYPI